MMLSQEIRWLGIAVFVDVGGQGNFIHQCGFGYQADRRRVQLFRLTFWLLCSGPGDRVDSTRVRFVFTVRETCKTLTRIL